ncbi:MAG TPA: DUF6585 family protein [Bryobacteraceae bacterium]|nr:DUF6585 family protein [Bryobacteraceae bacterium]
MATDFAIPEALRGSGSPVEVHTPTVGSGRTTYFILGAAFVLVSVLTVVGLLNPRTTLLRRSSLFRSRACSWEERQFGSYTKSYALILFPDALVRTGGSSPESFRWTDIAEIYTFINPVAGKYRIVTQGGRKLEIDSSVKDGGKLGEAVQQTVCEHRLPAAMKSFDVGETLTFGPLAPQPGPSVIQG